MSMDSGKFRKGLGFFAGSVTVTTVRGPSAESASGTLNFFASVFPDPTLILICLANITGCFNAFYAAGRFAGHVQNA